MIDILANIGVAVLTAIGVLAACVTVSTMNEVGRWIRKVDGDE